MYKKLIRNKYFIATLLFVLLLVFSERNSVMDQFRLEKQLKEARTQHDYFTREIQRVKDEHNKLFSNPANLEKFAREKYLMKKDGEDVFLIVKEKH